METRELVYRSAEKKTEEEAHLYSKTHEAPHRYLAYRDIPIYLQRFLKGRRVLDYGAGTGASSFFLYNLGLDVTGVDISTSMLSMARSNFPSISFFNIEGLASTGDFDMVFSSFVLFELASKKDIIKYLSLACACLKKDGIFIGITGSEHLYSLCRNWMTFDANFEENRNLRSGDIARLVLKEPEMEFYDYYWKTTDYLDCFKKAGLEMVQVQSPLGSLEDTYPWKDELLYSPFTIFIARNTAYKQY